MEIYKKHLSKDKKIKPLLKCPISIPKKQKNIALRLAGSIVSQQLSTKVAQVMYGRFLELFGEKEPTPEDILKIPVATIKAIGLSQQKAQYIHNVAQFVYDHQLTDSKLRKLPDQEIIDLLIQIKGVGKWSVEMLLMFSLGREDIFAIDDYGIQKAMIKLYKLEHLEKKELKLKMLKLSQSWSPYRSFACLHLWNFLDT